ncbi:MAG: EF-hand domain-containing protein [Paracoccus sp. (in: a-proteobacteria)]|nr:EF-hand domain-containing protein [Paracoccus sp. (in: a-proteobacteria)]
MKRTTVLTLGAVATAAVIGTIAIPAIAQSWGSQQMMQWMHGGGQMDGHARMGGPGGHAGKRMEGRGMGNHAMRQSLDADGDGTVTEAEMEAGMIALHAKHDADGDGTLSSEEFAAMVKTMDGPAADRPFAMLDADGDGQISVEEMTFPAQMMARMNRGHGGASDGADKHR